MTALLNLPTNNPNVNIPIRINVSNPNLERMIRQDMTELLTSSVKFRQYVGAGELIDGIRQVIITDNPSATNGFSPFVQALPGAASFQALNGIAYVYVNPNISGTTINGSQDTIAGLLIHEFFHFRKDVYNASDSMAVRHQFLLPKENEVRDSLGLNRSSLETLNNHISSPPKPFVDSPQHCFVADTPILMADGTEKPIQDIEAGDMVMSFDPSANDGLGAHVPQQVTRTFRNTTRVLIDLHGLKVTPGHEFLSDKGEWMNIANILRRDRAYVLDENGVGVPYRARTKLPLKSLGDAVFTTRFIDPRTGAERRAEVRGAIHFDYIRLTEGGVISRRPGSLVEMLHLSKRLSVQAFARDGALCDAEGKPVGVLDWPAGTMPFDFEGNENFIVTLDGLAFTPDWIRNIPHDGEETQAVMHAGGGAEDGLILSPHGMRTMRFESGKGQFNAPAPRQSLPPLRPQLAASNPTRVPMNRMQRRKQAALKRVK